MVGTMLIALVGAFLGAVLSRDQGRLDWPGQARDWRDRGVEIRNQIRSAAPDVSKAADDAGRHVSQTARQIPISGLLIAAAVGSLLGYLLHGRSS